MTDWKFIVHRQIAMIPLNPLRHPEQKIQLNGQCHFPQAPDNNIRVISNFLQKFSEIFISQSAPPVSTTLESNFATGIPGVVDICR
jgi:hypothetical protein